MSNVFIAKDVKVTFGRRAAPPGDAEATRLADIRARADAATPGPWRTTIFEGVIPEWFQVFTSDGLCVVRQGIGQGNALFVAHAREDVPYLLALVTDLQRVVADLCEESDAARLALRYREALARIAGGVVRPAGDLEPMLGVDAAWAAREVLGGKP